MPDLRNLMCQLAADGPLHRADGEVFTQNFGDSLRAATSTSEECDIPHPRRRWRIPHSKPKLHRMHACDSDSIDEDGEPNLHGLPDMG